MGERIYVRRGDSLEPMEEEGFALEDTLQELIAEHPELLDGEQITPDNPRRWILVTREKGIPVATGGSGWWSLDNLYIDQDAIPTLVEVERGANPQIRREVVGQMLDYAAHAHYWTAGELRRAFEASNSDPDTALLRMISEEDEAGIDDGDPESRQEIIDSFWERVGTNLAARNMRLLFVADAIPDELSQIVEFLNEQMTRVEVLAVEIKQFRNESGQTLVPRVIGTTAAAPGKSAAGRAATRKKITMDEFMDQLPGDDVREATERLLGVAKSHGATVVAGDKGFTVRGNCRLWPYPVTVAWLYPPSDRTFWSGYSDFTFGTGILHGYDPGPGQELRAFLEDWAQEFANDDFGRDQLWTDGAGTSYVAARTIGHDDVVTHVETLSTRLAAVLDRMAGL